MSITLTAFPTAFLVSPDTAKKITLAQIADKIKNKKLKSLITNYSSLRNIRILTNLRISETPRLMAAFDEVKRVGEFEYTFKNGLNVEWKYIDGYCCAILSAENTAKIVPKYGEELFKNLDKIKNVNVRDINSEEYFYYNYITEYTDADQIITELKMREAENIVKTSEKEIKATYNKQNIRYYQDYYTNRFILETEQKISLVNIGMDDSNLAMVEIKTNITPEEIKSLLNNFGYDFNEITNQTPLKMSSNIIEWSLKDNYYTAKLRNISSSHLKGEVEHLFAAMNKKAGRDLRITDNKSELTYTYKTNYTDKGVLLNTLTEHGAKKISETDDKISCELFGMQMSYTKDADNQAYNLVIERVTDKSECEGLISDLNDEYGLNIQEITYKKILDRIESENLHLEKEEVLEDNSILLTIEV